MPGIDNLFRSLSVARIAMDHPLTYVDLGGRGGFQADIAPLGFAVHAVGFEPDPEAFAALNGVRDARWASVTWIPAGVSGSGGLRRLNIPGDPAGSSLLSPEPNLGRKFHKPQYFEIVRSVDVDTITMHDVATRADVAAIDYLKIDIEGAELEVFESMGPLLDDVLAIKTEVAFVRMRQGAGLAREIDGFLTGRGFALMDLIDSHRWRREGTVLHPLFDDVRPSYTRGQLVQGDCLYLREPESLGDDADKLLKLALICMALGYFDHALMALETETARRVLKDTYGAEPIDIVAPAAVRYGRRMVLMSLTAQVRGVLPFARALVRAFLR